MIRLAEVADIPKMIEISCMHDENIYQDASEEIIEIFHQNNGEFFVYEVDGVVVGFMGYKFKKWGGEDVYWAIWLYIDPNFKRRKIGTKLYNHIEKELKRKKCRKIYLDVGNEENHKEAISFHLKNGFKLEAKLNDFWDSGEHCLLYSKYL